MNTVIKARKYRVRRGPPFARTVTVEHASGGPAVAAAGGGSAPAAPLPEGLAAAPVASGASAPAATESPGAAAASPEPARAGAPDRAAADRGPARPAGMRPPQAAPSPAAPPSRARPPADEDGFGAEPFPTAEQDMLLGPGERRVEDEITRIRGEGLTARQLRMARRVAERHGIEAANDFDAVRLLRKRGIDPFDRASLLELVRARPAEQAPAGDRANLPQTVKPAQGLPGPRAYDDSRRAAEILNIQRDIARRRQRRMILLFARLAVFVLLPTLLAGIYYYRIATPLYGTKSAFVIQQAEAQATGLGAMFRGTQFATSQDSITVQSYLQSRDAMLRLDADLGFKAHFSQPWIDPVQRLSPDATNEDAYRVYKRNVRIGYDPSEGLVNLEVIAADPVVSQKFSEALIGYAEEQVDQLTQRLREDQMKGARDSYQDAERKVAAAQQKVLALQEKLGVLDPKTETTVIMNQVSTFEVQLRKKELELQALLDNSNPNQARVDGARADIERLRMTIADLRAEMTQGGAGTASLASVTGQLRIAEADLETRQLMLSQALQQLETARIEANRQVRYLSLGVSPVAPDEATYPRAFENTLLAFLVFGGIYLMMSLTASILREQVSA